MRGIQVLDRPADRQLVTSGLAPRRSRSAPALQTSRPVSVETLTVRIATLVDERQQLRGRAARPAVLERNRLQIIRAQWELARALIDRHLPALPEQTAA
jgi:hypothetical protein